MMPDSASSSSLFCLLLLDRAAKALPAAMREDWSTEILRFLCVSLLFFVGASLFKVFAEKLNLDQEYIAIGERLIFFRIEISPFIGINGRNPIGVILMNIFREVYEVFQVFLRQNFNDND
mgnify:CR=1 FL=1